MQKRTKGTIRDTICFYQTAGHRLEEILHVYWNDYPDHSHYRFARRVLWHRRRTVLRHRLLWRRSPPPPLPVTFGPAHGAAWMSPPENAEKKKKFTPQTANFLLLPLGR